jgi:hypothetical protein
MNKRNLNEGQWEDKKQWSLGVRQRRKTFWNWYIYIYIYINLYMFQATMCPSLWETTVFMWHLVFVILYGLLHNRQSSIQNNKYQVSHKHSCFFW